MTSRLYGLRARTVRTTAMAMACGIAIANVYYNQPLLALMKASYPDAPAIGFIPTMTQLGYAVGLFCLVPLGDIVERRRLIAVQFVCLAAALVVFAWAQSVPALIASAIVMGFVATVSQQVLPFAASLAEPAERGAAVGAVMSGLFAGILFSRTLAGLVGTYFGWRAMFWISAPLALLGAALMFAILPATTPAARLRYIEAERSLLTLWLEEPRLRRAAIVQGLLFGSFLAFWTILSLHLREPAFDRGADVAGAFGIIGVAGIIAAPFTGRLADRRGAHRVVVAGTLLTFASWLAFGLWPGLAGLIVGVLLMDLGIQAALISNQQIIYALRPEARNRCNTVFMTMVFLGGTIGSTGAALAYAHAGWPGTCAFGGALALAAFALQMRGPRRARSQQRLMVEAGAAGRHRLYEDVAAVLLGTLVVSLGLVFYAQATLVTSGAAGLALLLSYATGLPFGALFLGINLPFFILSLVRLGWSSTLRTFAAICLVSAATSLTPHWFVVASVAPLYAAIVGGTLAGLGLLILFRHRTGLGGTNILALYLQERYGLRAGYLQLAIDAVILIGAATILPPTRVALSFVGALILNLIIAINHRPGRYTAVS